MLEQEIGFIRDLSLKYMQEGTTLKERVKNLEQTEQELRLINKKTTDLFEKEKRKLVDALQMEKKNLIDEYEKEKELMTEELRITDVIRK